MLEVSGDSCTGADGDTVLDGHWGNKLTVRADKDVIANLCFELICSVIVAGYGSGTDINLTTYLGISKVGEMSCFGVKTKVRFFKFHEITDVYLIVKTVSGTESGKRPDGSVDTQGGIFHNGIR